MEARSANGQPRYRAWALALCLAYAAVLLALGWQQLLAERLWLFGLAFAAALAATWADIPVSALAIRLLPASERMRAGGVRSGAVAGRHRGRRDDAAHAGEMGLARALPVPGRRTGAGRPAAGLGGAP